MKRKIDVSLDTFSRIWSVRRPNEANEDEIIGRLLDEATIPLKPSRSTEATVLTSKPASKKWTDVLTWALQELGGKATLADIYKWSRKGRLALGCAITKEHDASARECLEAHCKASRKFREKEDLFWMPEGKGAGIWALNRSPHWQARHSS